MTQNINLLEELNIKPPVTLSSKLIVQISTVWLLLLFFIYFLASGIHSFKQKELPNLETKQKNLSSKIAIYQREFPALNAKKPVDSKDYTSKLINTSGFYQYFKDLATLVPHGLWLNEMTFSRPDNLVTLKGSAILASSISKLINSLGKSNSFRSKKFNVLQLQENPKTHNTDFTVSTTIPGVTNNTNNKKPNKKNELIIH